MDKEKIKNNEVEQAKCWLSALDIKSEFEASLKEYILSYIEQLEKENKTLKHINKSYKGIIRRLNKMIDEMAYQLAGLAIWNNEKEETLILGDKEEVKQYFEKKVEGK